MKKYLTSLVLTGILCSPSIYGQTDSTMIKKTSGMQIYTGGINIYENKGTVYFEIPASLFGKDLLWYAEIKSSPLVTGMISYSTSPGTMINNLAIRLEKRDNKIFLRETKSPLLLRLPEGPVTAEDRERMTRSLNNVNIPPVLLALPVVATGANGSVLVDVSAVLNRNLPFFDVKSIFPGTTIADPARSYIEAFKSFPNNIRFTSTLTFDVMPGNELTAMFIKLNSYSATVSLAHSIYILPENKMSPRLADPRIGYFDTPFRELQPGNGYLDKAYISRYRLEKKNPEAVLSEPVKPIVYYIGPDVPARWRPIFKQAVEMWNSCFEKIGFKNAIVAKDPPNDPNWSADDLGHSVIRWVNQPVANAMGPRTVDPRTGEILSAHVMIWEDVFSLAQQWYYLQGFGSDKRAARLPLPMDIQDNIMRYIVAHEVGHSIGLRHNHRAGQAYTTAQLRDKQFANANGPVASIMSYGRINYVAQPGDGVSTLIPRIGPYDDYVIRYGYEPIPSMKNPDAEIPTLNKWLEAQRTNPVLLWSAEDAAAQIDPTVLTENVGKDRIESARLGIQNLQRAVDNLPVAIGQLPQDIQQLKTYYKTAVNERNTWLEAAAKELLGFIEYRYLDPARNQFQPVPGARKKEVLQYLLGELKEVSPLFTAEMKKIFMPEDIANMMITSQSSLLDKILLADVIKSFETVSLVSSDNYSLLQYFGEIADGLFTELKENNTTVNPVRRALQHQFIKSLLSFRDTGPVMAREASRQVIKDLQAKVLDATGRFTSRDSQAYLAQLTASLAK